LGAPEECDEYEPDELDYRYQGEHIFVYGDEIDESGTIFNRITGVKNVEKERREDFNRHNRESTGRNADKHKEDKAFPKENERQKTNTPHHRSRGERGGNDYHSSTKRRTDERESDDYMRNFADEENMIRSPRSVARIGGERIRYSEVELNDTTPEAFRNFVKKLNIFEKEVNVGWDRSLIHKDVTGLLDLRRMHFVKEQKLPDLDRSSWMNVFPE
jgi:hypothetical protein